MNNCACEVAIKLGVSKWACIEHGYIHGVTPNSELIKNGDHIYIFPPDPSHDNSPNIFGKCQGPCRMIVTKKEALYRPMGLCNKS